MCRCLLLPILTYWTRVKGVVCTKEPYPVSLLCHILVTLKTVMDQDVLLLLLVVRIKEICSDDTSRSLLQAVTQVIQGTKITSEGHVRYWFFVCKARLARFSMRLPQTGRDPLNITHRTCRTAETRTALANIGYTMPRNCNTVAVACLEDLFLVKWPQVSWQGEFPDFTAPLVGGHMFYFH